MFFLISIAVSIALSYASYLLMPRPKQVKPTSTPSELKYPSVSAGRPIPVVFGTVTIKSPNILWYGDKGMREYEIDA